MIFILISRDEKKVEKVLPEERKLIKKESELEEDWKEKMSHIGTFYSYRFAKDSSSFQLRTLEEIEKSLNDKGVIIFINKKNGE